MSLNQIEAELENLTSEELRRLALKSWMTFVKRERISAEAHECSEEDPEALKALDNAINRDEMSSHQGYTAEEMRARISQWNC